MTPLYFIVHENKEVFHCLFNIFLLVGAITYHAEAADSGHDVVL
mgnify:CR=1 FL=1